jgi:hypothetical protein
LTSVRDRPDGGGPVEPDGPPTHDSDPNGTGGEIRNLIATLSDRRNSDRHLLPRLAAGLADADDESRKMALAVLAAYGERASQYADVIADSVHAVARSDDTTADTFAWTMAAMRDDRCLPVLRRRVLTGHFTYRTARVYFPRAFEGFDPPTLGEVLTPLVAHSGELLEPLLRLVAAPTTSDRAKEQVLSALGEWGGRASPGAPEVASLLGSSPRVDAAAADVLAAVGPGVSDPMVDRIDAYLAGDAPAGLEVAYARWRITGESEPALGALGAAVEAGRGYYLGHLARMGAVAHRHIPAVRRFLAQRLNTRVEAVHALWMLGDDVPEAPAILTEAVRPLAQGFSAPYVTPALRYTAEMGTLSGEAADILATAVASPRRLDGLHGGWRLIAEDHEVQSLARSALTHAR